MPSTTEEALRRTFSEFGGAVSCVERVKKMKDYAFVHFVNRESAEKAFRASKKLIIDGSEVEVSWWVETIEILLKLAVLMPSLLPKHEPRNLEVFNWLCMFSLPKWGLKWIMNKNIKPSRAYCMTSLFSPLIPVKPQFALAWIQTEGGGHSTVDLLSKVACFLEKVNNIFNLKRSWSKLVNKRRSTVLSLSL